MGSFQVVGKWWVRHGLLNPGRFDSDRNIWTFGLRRWEGWHVGGKDLKRCWAIGLLCGDVEHTMAQRGPMRVVSLNQPTPSTIYLFHTDHAFPWRIQRTFRDFKPGQTIVSGVCSRRRGSNDSVNMSHQGFCMVATTPGPVCRGTCVDQYCTHLFTYTTCMSSRMCICNRCSTLCKSQTWIYTLYTPVMCQNAQVIL